MDKVAQARIRRAETALLNLGIKSRDELAIYDLRAGVEGLSGIGPTLRKVIDKARRMTDSEFVATFPLIPLHAPIAPTGHAELSPVEGARVEFYPADALLEGAGGMAAEGYSLTPPEAR